MLYSPHSLFSTSPVLHCEITAHYTLLQRNKNNKINGNKNSVSICHGYGYRDMNNQASHKYFPEYGANCDHLNWNNGPYKQFDWVKWRQTDELHFFWRYTFSFCKEPTWFQKQKSQMISQCHQRRTTILQRTTILKFKVLPLLESVCKTFANAMSVGPRLNSKLNKYLAANI